MYIPDYNKFNQQQAAAIAARRKTIEAIIMSNSDPVVQDTNDYHSKQEDAELSEEQAYASAIEYVKRSQTDGDTAIAIENLTDDQLSSLTAYIQTVAGRGEFDLTSIHAFSEIGKIIFGACVKTIKDIQ